MLNLTKRQFDSALFNFLFVDERLVDIGDDLVDYEDDVMANSFNIVRGRAPPYCAAEVNPSLLHSWGSDRLSCAKCRLCLHLWKGSHFAVGE